MSEPDPRDVLMRLAEERDHLHATAEAAQQIVVALDELGLSKCTKHRDDGPRDDCKSCDLYIWICAARAALAALDGLGGVDLRAVQRSEDETHG